MLLPGITLVISPLISLMKDQVQSLNQAGVHAAYINSSLTENQITKALQFAAEGRYKIIYIAPERLETYEFLNFAAQVEISMLTVDEAHCISQWGQDFRPSYLKKERKPKATYDEIFADLPTWEVVVGTLTEEEKQCPICGTQMIPIGHEVLRTEIIYTEPKLERIRYIATTYSCPVCKDEEDAPFVKDNGTPALIPENFASFGLAAHVMYYKYEISVSLYR